MAEPLRIGLVYPELLGTYGDRGNAEVLVWRAARHGLDATLAAARVDSLTGIVNRTTFFENAGRLLARPRGPTAIIIFDLDEFKKINGVDLGKDPIALQRIKSAAERAKIELSSTQQTEINEPYIAMANGAPVHMTMKISRAKLEALVEDLIEATIEPCRTAITDAGLKVENIDDVRAALRNTRYEWMLD